MDQKTYELIGADYPGNRVEDIKNPSLGWMIGFMFVVSFLGLFSLVPLRKVMVLDYKLTYPSGTATALLINSFHTHTGAELAGFYFDFSPTYIGCGLICPHIVNCSVLLGAIISWGFLWPFISQYAGDWYPADLGSNDFKGLYGYKVFIAIALILGDGLYNLIKIILLTTREICDKRSKQSDLPLVSSFQDKIHPWFAASGYVTLAAISTATIPTIFPQLKWYMVLVSYIIAPSLAFCNSYGTGLTDWNLASTYGKLGLFIFASLIGTNGGVMAGLAACGVMMSIVSTAADLMQDFKTGYLTYSSPRSMFVSQLVGTAMGCVIAPLTFWLYWTAFDIGSPDGPYKAPYAVIFREMAILGVEGFSSLPKHCLEICCGFFALALVVNLLRDVTPKKVSRFIPIPMAMAVPFYIGAYFAIDMFVGTVILFVWERLNKKESEDYAGAVASGLICGDGIWTVPSAVLSIFRINPPICMYFGPSGASS
ncbi:putative metal-nicotianamine transporter YSL6 [Acorus calamus]|uniref:Metal-nicotianamine transporter YSL6 n=1 Tax=Acorus calamus TaxID=4465 RepID=A0AAV9F0G1_ACOCL|nr:putative metal-nicotianamine transporter YSL6 [Acorus calamus]